MVRTSHWSSEGYRLYTYVTCVRVRALATGPTIGHECWLTSHNTSSVEKYIIPFVEGF